MVYPQGNNRSDAMALYLAVAEEEQAAFGLQRSATFKLALLSSVEGGDLAKEASHIFTGRETDWGAWVGAAESTHGLAKWGVTWPRRLLT